MTTDMPPPPPPPPPATPVAPEAPQSNRGKHIAYFIGGLVIVGLLVGGAIWFLRGDSEEGTASASAAAAAMPADAQMYFEFNLDAAPDLVRLVAAFEQAGAADLAEGLGDQLELDVGAGLGMLEELQTVLREDVGIDPSALADWVGGSAALAVYEMNLTSAEETPPQVLASIAVDDRAAATAFLDETIPTLEARHGLTFSSTEYEGVTFHSTAPGDLSDLDLGDVPMIVGLAGDSLLLGTDMDLMERAIDARSGSSLGDLTEFTDVMAALPDDAMMRGFMGSNLIAAFADGVMSADFGELTEGMSLPGFDLESIEATLDQLRGIGMAAELNDTGIRFDLVVLHEGDAPIELTGSSDFADLLPAEAIAYVGIPPFDVAAAWDQLLAMLQEMPVEDGGMSINDTLSLAEYALGIDLEEDLIYRMTGEVGLALLPATDGMLAEAAGVPLGIVVAAGVDDADRVADALAGIAGGLGALGMEPRPTTVAGADFHVLSDGSTDIAMFGMAGGNLVISTDADYVSAMLEGGDSLSDTDGFTRAASLLPGSPLFYLDMSGLMAAMDMPAEEAAGLAPLEAIAASMSQEDGLIRFTLAALIDY